MKKSKNCFPNKHPLVFTRPIQCGVTASQNLAQTEILTTTGWIAMKFCTDIYGPQRMNPTDFGDLMTFPKRHHEVFVSQ